MHRMETEGLIAATYTPMHTDGRVNPGAVGPMVEYLMENDVSGLFVCGSTGEGMSLTSEERRAVAEEFISAVAGRLPVLVHVGHNSLADARQLAAHAQGAGADAVSATCPSYFRPQSIETLVDCMAQVAGGAPDLPFYYYHIPCLTGVELSMVEFFQSAGDRIPNLAGLKFTDPKLHEYQQCYDFEDGRFDVLWGVDEMLLAALAVGARGFVGSTFNIAAPLYHRLIDAFERGDIDMARECQSQAVKMIDLIGASAFHPAMKQVLALLGLNCGGCRLPHPQISEEAVYQLRTDLTVLGFFEWASNGVARPLVAPA